jgi:hypothetical protein
MTYVDIVAIRLTISSDMIRPSTHELPTITFSDNKPYLTLPSKYVAATDNAQSAIVEYVIVTHFGFPPSIRRREVDADTALTVVIEQFQIKTAP